MVEQDTWQKNMPSFKTFHHDIIQYIYDVNDQLKKKSEIVLIVSSSMMNVHLFIWFNILFHSIPFQVSDPFRFFGGLSRAPCHP